MLNCDEYVPLEKHVSIAAGYLPVSVCFLTFVNQDTEVKIRPFEPIKLKKPVCGKMEHGIKS